MCPALILLGSLPSLSSSPGPLPPPTMQRLQGLGRERGTEKEDGEGVQTHGPRLGNLLTLSFILKMT